MITQIYCYLIDNINKFYELIPLKKKKKGYRKKKYKHLCNELEINFIISFFSFCLKE